MSYGGLVLICVLGAYLAVLLVIAIAILVTVRKLYRKLEPDDRAVDDDALPLTRDDHALLVREARRVQREMMDELREEARRRPAAADDDDAPLTRDERALLKREAGRVCREMMDSLRQEARR